MHRQQQRPCVCVQGNQGAESLDLYIVIAAQRPPDSQPASVPATPVPAPSADSVQQQEQHQAKPLNRAGQDGSGQAAEQQQGGGQPAAQSGSSTEGQQQVPGAGLQWGPATGSQQVPVAGQVPVLNWSQVG